MCTWYVHAVSMQSKTSPQPFGRGTITSISHEVHTTSSAASLTWLMLLFATDTEVQLGEQRFIPRAAHSKRTRGGEHPQLGALFSDATELPGQLEPDHTARHFPDVPRSNLQQPRRTATPLALAVALTGCATVGIPGFELNNTSISVVNAMSVPVCRVQITSTVDSDATYDNTRMSEAILPVGAEKPMFYKVPEKPEDNEPGGPAATYRVEAYGCTDINGVGDQLVTLDASLPGDKIVLR